MFSIKRLVKRNTKVVNRNRTLGVPVDNGKHDASENLDEEKENTEILETEKPIKNNSKKNKKNMVTEEQIASAENVANVLNDKKIIKKDKGLIERTESSKIILTEDNRQLLND